MKRKNKTFILVILIVFIVYFISTHFIFVSNNDSTNIKNSDVVEAYDYHFRNHNLLNDHFNKHGKDMGFTNMKDYEKGANLVISNPKSLHKNEKDDGDDLFYLEKTNEYVVLSKDGYIRTYFKPDKGKKYFDSK